MDGAPGAVPVKVSVALDAAQDVLLISASVPFQTSIISSNRTQLILSDLAFLCRDALLQAVRSWLYEKSDAASLLIESTPPEDM